MPRFKFLRLFVQIDAYFKLYVRKCYVSLFYVNIACTENGRSYAYKKCFFMSPWICIKIFFDARYEGSMVPLSLRICLEL